MEPVYALQACLKEFNLTNLPSNIEIKYIDSLDFFKLKQKEIPEHILKIPVITLEEENKKIIYVNFNELNENEYYVIELMLSQLIKALMNNNSEINSFKLKCKNSFFLKNIEIGATSFLEYKELSLLMKIMYKLYNTKEYFYQKRNPYTIKQNKKIAINMLSRTISEKQGQEKISSIIYCMARLQGRYNYKNIIKEENLSFHLNMLNELLQNNEIDNISKQTLNQIGIIIKEIKIHSN